MKRHKSGFIDLSDVEPNDDELLASLKKTHDQLKNKSEDEIAERLAYLWHLMEVDTQKYLAEGYAEEKDNIYTLFGKDREIFIKAHKYLEKL